MLKIFEFIESGGNKLWKIGHDMVTAKTTVGFKTKADAEVALREMGGTVETSKSVAKGKDTDKEEKKEDATNT